MDHTNDKAKLAGFKYYIHDSTERLRFQLVGELTEARVPELSGCWATAKTTLQERQLVIDLTALRHADDAGKQWLLSMAHEGAVYLPESYFRDGLARHDVTDFRQLGLFARILSVFRGRPIPAESTRVQ